MSATFTPGPWTLDDCRPPRGQGAFININAGDLWVGYAMGNHHDEPGFPSDTECEANARLMAAAPELYEALNWLMTYWFSLDPDELPDMPHVDAMVERARAALKKARGES